MTTPARIAACVLPALLSAAVLDQPVRAQSTSWDDTAFVGVTALHDAGSRTYSTAANQTIHQESTRFSAVHETAPHVLLDVSTGVRILGRLGVGVAATYGTSDTDVRITGDVPHPFFFDRPRPLSGTGTLRRTDLAVHLSARWLFPISRRFQVAAFGGPTWFRVDHETFGSVQLQETYPFDVVALGGYAARAREGSRVGAHGGFDASYVFSRHAGVHALVRYGDANVVLPDGAGSVKAGGLHLGGGLRIRY